MFIDCNHVGQVGKPDYLLSGAPLPHVMLSVVSPGVGIVSDVGSPIPLSCGSCDVVDVGVTAQCREVVLREAACDNLLLVARQEPSVLLEASFGQVVVKCQVPDTNSIVCDDSCRLSRSDK